MSYTINDERNEFAHRIEKCVEDRDIEEAYAIAGLFLKKGDEESANHFYKMARTWETSDDYFDLNKD